ncbi:MAG: pyridoxal-phosphate-dependent aminotransferase family protein [Candidatus Spyradocola sp.]|jgi:aspartate aminotransferase-like enzyme
MYDYNMLTPGPTKVRKNVLEARAIQAGNSDLDPEFYDFYKKTCAKYSRFLHTASPSFLLSGEGILGLEAACASLTEPGDRVLVLDNGIFGKGFADFVRLYGGEPVLLTTDPHAPIPADALRAFLKKDANFRYATLVHCDTPSGVLNDIHTLCPILKEYGILTVVDSVSGMFGNPVDVRRAKIDVLLGGSQKALSCPTGLTMVTVSQDAFRRMEERKTPIASFYANLLALRTYYEDQWFPYTMPACDIHGFARALDNVLEDPDIFARHARVATAVREALVAGGLSLYLKSGFSNTVTVFRVPQGLTDTDILSALLHDHKILLAGAFDTLAHKVIRIGHMGEAANDADMLAALTALSEVLPRLGFPLKGDMVRAYNYSAAR